MVEKTDRTATEAGPRSADGRRFEVFVREEETDPLRHVGTVAAPTPDIAHEEASKLFAWYARDVWVCPAEETHRYSADALGDDKGAPAVTRDADEPRGDGDPEEGGEPRADEPRVYEETEGTPTAGGAETEETR
ncbi:rSAM-partnered protein [Halorubrum alkaliphilum]|uniref:RSAM-partnered protein n=1 Tax=Halorubrum alkaliphilum TaxID=261290 RepID=A0A8T4GEL1_9EURY|nr:Htur_1727 family rSAM-partnered candidate RiPP [Halorubrum alkaliphilum]MBP1922918.1 rSAM-partnered protein [Halorubrum alkaliphilum]